MQCPQKLHSISHPPKRETNTYISNMRTCHQTQTSVPNHVHLNSIFQLELAHRIKKKKKKRNEHKKLSHSPNRGTETDYFIDTNVHRRRRGTSNSFHIRIETEKWDTTSVRYFRWRSQDGGMNMGARCGTPRDLDTTEPAPWQTLLTAVDNQV